MAVIELKRFTRAEYEQLAELGFFGDESRVELIEGQIIQMAAKGIAHEFCLMRLLRELSGLLCDQASLRCQSPIGVGTESEPEPDFTIVQNRDDDYLSAHPEASEVLLVIEVSDSSVEYDQGVKLSLYAKAGISHYWIFNLPDRWLETYSEPYQSARGNFGYRRKQVLLSDQTIPLPMFSELTLDLSKIFPVGAKKFS